MHIGLPSHRLQELSADLSCAGYTVMIMMASQALPLQCRKALETRKGAAYMACKLRPTVVQALHMLVAKNSWLLSNSDIPAVLKEGNRE